LLLFFIHKIFCRFLFLMYHLFLWLFCYIIMIFFFFSIYGTCLYFFIDPIYSALLTNLFDSRCPLRDNLGSDHVRSHLPCHNNNHLYLAHVTTTVKTQSL
jgi:hypothetical protein